MARPGRHHPLENDEFHSLEYYTWAGLKPTGDQQPLRRLEDVRKLPRPSLAQLGMGVYRSVALWKTPNNHLVHTVLLNFALLGGSPSERQIRLPAFAATIVFALAVYLFVRGGLGWRFAAPLAALGAFCLPYVYWYGNEARGHSATLALQVLFLIMARQAARRPASLGWGVAQAITAVLLFMNNVSMVLYWLFPAYLVLWFCPPFSGASSHILEERRLWRRNLILQLLGISAVGFLFLMDRLPYLLVASQINGDEASSTADFLTQGWGIVRYLFPDVGWAALGCLGLAGSVALCRSQENRWLGMLALGTILVTVLHCCLTKKVIYARACGFVLPMLVIGAAYLAERAGAVATGRGASSPWLSAWPLQGCWSGNRSLVAATTSTIPRPLPNSIPRSTRGMKRFSTRSCPAPTTSGTRFCPRNGLRPRTRSAATAAWIESSSWCRSRSTLTPRIGFTTWRLWRPPTRRCCSIPEVGKECCNRWSPAQPWRRDAWGYIRSCRSPCMPCRFPRPQRFPGKAPNLVVWYPDPLRVGIFGQPVMELLREADLPSIRRNHRFPAHLDYYNQLQSLEFVANSAQEWDKIKAVVARGMQRFGGRAVCLNATNEPGRGQGSAARETNPVTREKKVERVP